MTRGTKYVGLDVHQATTVASVRQDNGKIIAHLILPTEEPALREFIAELRGAIHVAFEEGTQAQWLAELLRPHVARVVVCNRRGEPTPAHKGDRRDADTLSARLWRGELRAVYHGDAARTTLKELSRLYLQLLTDSTRVMHRLKALFRARAIATPGTAVYHPRHRAAWLARLDNQGAQLRAQTLYAELDLLLQLRPAAKRAWLAEARRDPAWAVLQSVPFFGPVRVGLLLAIMQTPWRFRTKRQLWAYAGFAVVTRTTAEYGWEAGQPVRRTRPPLTRGLNRNRHPLLKQVFKGAAVAARSRPGPLQDWHAALLARGMRPEMADLTLARKLAAITLHLWKQGERFDPRHLMSLTR